MIYSKSTRAIQVTVEPKYLDDQSSPEEGQFLWSYRVRIDNEGMETVQLLRRHWSIIDANGRLQEVDGAGVVGEQPVLEPGQSYEYTSGTPLPTPSGMMYGRYSMETERGETFDVEIPAFSLDSPHQVVNLN